MSTATFTPENIDSKIAAAETRLEKTYDLDLMKNRKNHLNWLLDAKKRFINNGLIK